MKSTFSNLPNTTFDLNMNKQFFSAATSNNFMIQMMKGFIPPKVDSDMKLLLLQHKLLQAMTDVNLPTSNQFPLNSTSYHHTSNPLSISWSQHCNTMSDFVCKQLNHISPIPIKDESTDNASEGLESISPKAEHPNIFKAETAVPPAISKPFVIKREKASPIKKVEQPLAKPEVSSKKDEPALAEYTRAYPEWDLATIFEFLKSDRPIDEFEAERKIRVSNKKIGAKKRIAKMMAKKQKLAVKQNDLEVQENSAYKKIKKENYN